MASPSRLRALAVFGALLTTAFALTGCPASRGDAAPDIGPRDAPPIDAPPIDAPGLDASVDAPGSLDDGGTTDPDADPTLDAGPGTLTDAPDAPRVSMPCTAMGACDPFDTTSCPLGEGCLMSATGTACMALASTLALVGEACTLPNGCERGALCLSFAAEGFRCHRMCPEGSIGFCGGAATCSGTLGDPCVQVCRALPARCDIYAQDCADPALACSLAENFETGERYTGCRVPGTNVEGAACGGGMGACAEGLVCVSLAGANTCHRVCREDGGFPMCTAPETCVGRTGGWGVTFCRTPAPAP